MKILFGVFDWGLGHATRDIPIIEELLRKKHIVHILSTGRALKVLQEYFGKQCTYFDVESITVPYPRYGYFTLKFLVNIPTMLVDLKKARMQTEKIIQKEKYDKVISDCRYDVYDREDNSYLINHQVRFKAPAIFEGVLEDWLFTQMKHYKYVIVSDYEAQSLTGRLSHELRCVPIEKIKYVGIVSHLKKKRVKEDIDYFISISGPEPQRTVFEEKILSSLQDIQGKIVITLGKPESKSITKNKNIIMHTFLNSQEQEEIMNRAKCIISRSGYTTVMNLVELEKKRVLFIPTPGQTEQEYLGKIYETNKWFHCVPFKKINLKKDIAKIEEYTGYHPAWKTKKSVEKIIQAITE